MDEWLASRLTLPLLNVGDSRLYNWLHTRTLEMVFLAVRIEVQESFVGDKKAFFD